MAPTDDDALRTKMQKKSFTTWINIHLKKVGESITEITTDFGDGIKLIKLMEVLSEDSLGKYSKKPVGKFQKVENINVALKYINNFIKEQGISNFYSAENIIDEHETLILGMVWSIILRFAVSEISEGDRTAKEGLLLWAQKKVAEGSNDRTKVSNFHTSWQDGNAFCALINAFRPDLLDFEKVINNNSKDRQTMVDKLNLAFDIADDKLGIPKLLDADDMTLVRPDEKSVMTYITFFWKLFAGDKRKALASDQIANVVAREITLEEMRAEYEKLAASQADWLQKKIAEFTAGSKGLDFSELQQKLDEYVEYGRTEKSAKIQELMEAEALFANIQSRLGTLGRTYAPSTDLSLPTLQRWWEDLALVERTYDAMLNKALLDFKKMGGLIKIFQGKAKKLDHWLTSKSMWLAAQHSACNQGMGQPGLDPDTILPSRSAEAKAAAAGMASRTPSASVAADPLGGAVDLSAEGEAPAEGGGSGGGQRGRGRRGSVFAQVFDVIADTGGGLIRTLSGGVSAAASLAVETPAADEPDETPAAPPSLGKQLSLGTSGRLEGLPIEDQMTAMTIAAEAVQSPKRKASMVSISGYAPEEAPLDSVSSVLAKQNLYKAYEEECAARNLTLEKLRKLLEQIASYGCPTIDALRKTFAGLETAVGELGAANGAYSAALAACLAYHQELDEMRLTFAKRGEALHRWTDEAQETMEEVLVIGNVAEAEDAEGDLATFRDEFASKKAELEALAAYKEEMEAKGVTYNPYARFDIPSLEEALASCEEASAERVGRLGGERERLATIDTQKKEFAAAADVFIEWLKAEKITLEENTPVASIHPDNAEEIAAGKTKLAYLTEYKEKAPERAAQLTSAQTITDALLAVGELDNPYTKYSMPALKGMVDMLEKLVRDKVNLIEGQLARAQATITPEQHAELEAAFKHFDKNKNNSLNQLEFAAAMKSLAFPEDEMASLFSKYAEPGATGDDDATINFEAFVTIVLQQYKDKDTLDGLLAAFDVLANGKETLPPEAISQSLKPEHADYLKGKMTLADDGGYDYHEFAESVYGSDEPLDRSLTMAFAAKQKKAPAPMEPMAALAEE